jgi:hypothetical protein
MLVLSMTTEEIYREIMRDLDTVKRRSDMEALILQKQMLRKKLQNEVRTLCYKTQHRNEWQIVFHIDCKGIKKAFYLQTRDHRGMVAYTIEFMDMIDGTTEKYLVKYNSHFFQRYNERMQLGFSDQAKTIKYFFKKNLEYKKGATEIIADKLRNIHFVYENGIGIGWQDDAVKAITMKTFVSNDILTRRQRSLAEHITHGGDDEEFSLIIKLENFQKALSA